MVILGGLEVVAAGYLLHDYNKKKAKDHTKQELQDWEKRQRREDRRRREEYKRLHGHSPPPSQSLHPPTQHHPPRPSSAPPAPYPQSQQKPQQGPWQHGPPLQSYNYAQPSWPQGQQHPYGPPPMMQQNYQQRPQQPPQQWQQPPPMPYYPAQNPNNVPYTVPREPQFDAKNPNLYSRPQGSQYGSQQFGPSQISPHVLQSRLQPQQTHVPSPRPGSFEMAGDVPQRRPLRSEVSSMMGEMPDPPPAYSAYGGRR